MVMRDPMGYPPVKRNYNGMAIASLVCAVMGVFVLEIVLGPLAVVLGLVGLQRARAGAPNRNIAIAGIVLGAIDVILILALLAYASAHGHVNWHL